MNNKTHNGWYNYETWAVALWMDNEQGSQERWRESALLALENPGSYYHAGFTREEMAASALEDELRAAHEESMPEMKPDVYFDLLTAAMSEVNWREIAKHLIADVIAEAKP